MSVRNPGCGLAPHHSMPDESIIHRVGIVWLDPCAGSTVTEVTDSVGELWYRTYYRPMCGFVMCETRVPTF